MPPPIDFQKLFKGTLTKPVGFAEASRMNKFTKPPVQSINPMEFYKQSKLPLYGNTNQGIFKGFDVLKVADQNSSRYPNRPWVDPRITTPGSIPNQITSGALRGSNLHAFARGDVFGAAANNVNRGLGIFSVLAELYDAVGDNVTNEQMNAGAEAYPWWIEEWLMNAIGVRQ
jgi:hypothetical protein